VAKFIYEKPENQEALSPLLSLGGINKRRVVFG